MDKIFHFIKVTKQNFIWNCFSVHQSLTNTVRSHKCMKLLIQSKNFLKPNKKYTILCNIFISFTFYEPFSSCLHLKYRKTTYIGTLNLNWNTSQNFTKLAHIWLLWIFLCRKKLFLHAKIYFKSKLSCFWVVFRVFQVRYCYGIYLDTGYILYWA